MTSYPIVRAPEFAAGAEDWLNGGPLRMADLKGKVVLIDFWEYTCVNCIRTFPYLLEWHRRYAEHGLVIVGIHTPEFAFAKDRANVEAAIERFGFGWPVLQDNEKKNWSAYANRFWPRKFVIDPTGRVVYDRIGEGGYGETEAKIQELLRAVNPNLELPELMEPVRLSDVAGAVCYPVTREMYAGLRGFENGQFGYDDFPFDAPTEFTLPPELKEGVFYLQGTWSGQDEALVAGAEASMRVQYKAKEMNAVLRPGAESGRVEVLQDGKPLRPEDAGGDVSFESGRSWVVVDSDRMYSLTVNERWGEHELTLVFEPGIRLYSCTFSTDCTSR